VVKCDPAISSAPPKGSLFACPLADCGPRALQIDRLTTHWLRLLPLEILTIDYEKLVLDLQARAAV